MWVMTVLDKGRDYGVDIDLVDGRIIIDKISADDF